MGLHKIPHKLNKLNQLTSCDKVARQVDKKNAVDSIYVDVKKALLIGRDNSGDQENCEQGARMEVNCS